MSIPNDDDIPNSIPNSHAKLFRQMIAKFELSCYNPSKIKNFTMQNLMDSMATQLSLSLEREKFIRMCNEKLKTHNIDPNATFFTNEQLQAYSVPKSYQTSLEYHLMMWAYPLLMEFDIPSPLNDPADKLVEFYTKVYLPRSERNAFKKLELWVYFEYMIVHRSEDLSDLSKTQVNEALEILRTDISLIMNALGLDDSDVNVLKPFMKILDEKENHNFGASITATHTYIRTIGARLDIHLDSNFTERIGGCETFGLLGGDFDPKSFSLEMIIILVLSAMPIITVLGVHIMSVRNSTGPVYKGIRNILPNAVKPEEPVPVLPNAGELTHDEEGKKGGEDNTDKKTPHTREDIIPYPSFHSKDYMMRYTIMMVNKEKHKEYKEKVHKDTSFREGTPANVFEKGDFIHITLMKSPKKQWIIGEANFYIRLQQARIDHPDFEIFWHTRSDVKHMPFDYRDITHFTGPNTRERTVFTEKRYKFHIANMTIGAYVYDLVKLQISKMAFQNSLISFVGVIANEYGFHPETTIQLHAGALGLVALLYAIPTSLTLKNDYFLKDQPSTKDTTTLVHLRMFANTLLSYVVTRAAYRGVALFATTEAQLANNVILGPIPFFSALSTAGAITMGVTVLSAYNPAVAAYVSPFLSMGMAGSHVLSSGLRNSIGPMATASYAAFAFGWTYLSTRQQKHFNMHTYVMASTFYGTYLLDDLLYTVFDMCGFYQLHSELLSGLPLEGFNYQPPNRDTRAHEPDMVPIANFTTLTPSEFNHAVLNNAFSQFSIAAGWYSTQTKQNCHTINYLLNNKNWPFRQQDLGADWGKEYGGNEKCSISVTEATITNAQASVGEAAGAFAGGVVFPFGGGANYHHYDNGLNFSQPCLSTFYREDVFNLTRDMALKQSSGLSVVAILAGLVFTYTRHRALSTQQQQNKRLLLSNENSGCQFPSFERIQTGKEDIQIPNTDTNVASITDIDTIVDTICREIFSEITQLQEESPQNKEAIYEVWVRKSKELMTRLQSLVESAVEQNDVLSKLTPEELTQIAEEMETKYGRRDVPLNNSTH